MTIYQIVDWDEHFESSRSREIENPAFVLMPNKQHGMGFTRLTRLPGLEGAAAFGLWCMILQACSRQMGTAKSPRAGWLTDDGTPTGVPWDASDLALRWCLPVEFVQKVLDLLCSSKVGWIKAHAVAQQEVANTADQLPTVCRPSADPLPTEQNRTEQNRTEIHPNADGIAWHRRTIITTSLTLEQITAMEVKHHGREIGVSSRMAGGEVLNMAGNDRRLA